MRRHLSSLRLTRTKLDIAGFFALSAVSFGPAPQLALLFLITGTLLYLFITN